MTYKVSMTITTDQIENMIDQLPARDRIRLVRKLELKTWPQRLNDLFKSVDNRRKKTGVTNKELLAEVKQARKEFYASRA